MLGALARLEYLINPPAWSTPYGIDWDTKLFAYLSYLFCSECAAANSAAILFESCLADTSLTLFEAQNSRAYEKLGASGLHERPPCAGTATLSINLVSTLYSVSSLCWTLQENQGVIVSLAICVWAYELVTLVREKNAGRWTATWGCHSQRLWERWESCECWHPFRERRQATQTPTRRAINDPSTCTTRPSPCRKRFWVFVPHIYQH